MSWSVSLIVLASLSSPDAQTAFGSYTKAYWTANAAHRPMLVILNPAAEAGAESTIALENLQQDERTRAVLSNYIVAIIDTGNEHGKAVHELFGSPPLPRVVVIDERQDKQVFQSSEHLAPADFARILEQYRTNAVPATTNVSRYHPTIQGSLNSFQQGGTCPNCRRY